MTVNYGEYAIGVYEKRETVEARIAKLIREEQPDVPEDISDELVREDYDADGYYHVLEIREDE